MAVKKFDEWITEQENMQPNMMDPSGHTPMAGGNAPALGNAMGDEQEEQETKHLSQSLMSALDRLLPKIAKLKNKQAGIEVVETILNKVHEALPQITQTVLMKIVKGTMQPQQQPQQQAPSPHMPPMPPQGAGQPQQQ